MVKDVGNLVKYIIIKLGRSKIAKRYNLGNLIKRPVELFLIKQNV